MTNSRPEQSGQAKVTLGNNTRRCHPVPCSPFCSQSPLTGRVTRVPLQDTFSANCKVLAGSEGWWKTNCFIMKLQGTVGSDTRVYHVNTGVVLGTSTVCVGGGGSRWQQQTGRFPKPMKSGCQVKAFYPATPTQSQFNPVRTSERFLLEILLTSIFL